MAKLRHIAIAAEDPFATAEFYKKVFALEEVGRKEFSNPETSYGVFLSDGTISLAILHFGWDQGHGIDFRGIHHLGFVVENLDSVTEELQSMGANCFEKRPKNAHGYSENKFVGPDKVIFDVVDNPWLGATKD
jgi:catechol 2,3-dioxygenase-like lactoylglutathione lyase family enzyme